MPTAFLVNPSKKSRLKAKKSAQRRVLRNPRRKAAAAPKRRRKPHARKGIGHSFARARKSFGKRVSRGGMGDILKTKIMPAVVGAAGALTVDVVMGYIPLPASLNTVHSRPLVKGALAVLLGVVAGKMGHAKLGRDLAVGSLTVAMHDSGRSMVQKLLPTANLGEYVNGMGYYSPATIPDAAMGEYVNGNPAFMGQIPFMSNNARIMAPFGSQGFQTGTFGASSSAGYTGDDFDV
jgi:hypothetical protein